MILLEKICEELGIELEEEWVGNDGNYYKISNSGELIMISYFDDPEKIVFEYIDDISRVLVGELKPKWKPEMGEEFCLMDLIDDDLYDVMFWSDSEINQKWLERGLVFKSSEEAINAANKMLQVMEEV